MFALDWALGYRFAPRLADVADHRLWRIDAKADYGQLNGLARNKINTGLIASLWDQICRLTASLEARTVPPSSILRTLQRSHNPSMLSRAIGELGRVVKTLHMLNYCHDPTYRRDIGSVLNRGENRNRLARDVFHSMLGQLRHKYQTGQENQLGALGLMANIIVLWQTVYTQHALDHLADNGYPIKPADVARLSPLGPDAINLKGRYRTATKPPNPRPTTPQNQPIGQLLCRILHRSSSDPIQTAPGAGQLVGDLVLHGTPSQTLIDAGVDPQLLSATRYR